MALHPPMVRIPDWSTLGTLIGSARSSLLLCSPYVSTGGIERVFDLLSTPVRLEIVTRLSPSDWANGISDPKALAALLRLLADDGWPLTLWVHQRLHAKVYIADSEGCVIGSANLTEGGFDRNFELVVSGGADLASQAGTLLRMQLEHYGRKIGIDSLEKWVAESTAVVEAAIDRDHEADVLADSQRQLDLMLGLSRRQPRQLSAQSDIGEFAGWLRRHAHLPGAQMILDRYENTSGQNLQGHVKQTFVGSRLFLSANPDLLKPCQEVLETTAADDVPVLSEDVAKRWSDFLDDNADYEDELGDFAVLRGILPPSLGGTRTGGGGGSSTLKRMLPLVARFILPRGA
jgi:phospholipase D-like protein